MNSRKRNGSGTEIFFNSVALDLTTADLVSLAMCARTFSHASSQLQMTENNAAPHWMVSFPRKVHNRILNFLEGDHVRRLLATGYTFAGTGWPGMRNYRRRTILSWIVLSIPRQFSILAYFAAILNSKPSVFRCHARWQNILHILNMKTA